MSTASTSAAGAVLPPKSRFALILALLAAVVYGNTFVNGYALDDIPAIAENRIVSKGITAIPEIFSTPYWYGFNSSPNGLYRPLPLSMFAVEYGLTDGDPMISHVMNVLLFAGCVVLLFAFIDQHFERKKTIVAFIAAALFALHPVHTEVVANIKSRDEILCFFFGFLALNLLLRYAAGGRLYLLFAACAGYFLSLLSKETSLCFLAIVPLIFFFYQKADRRRSIQITAAVLVVTGIYLAIRFAVLHRYEAAHPFGAGIAENSLAGTASLWTREATALLILGKYLLLLLIPYPLVCDYSYNSIPLAGFGHIGVITALLVYGGLLATGMYRLLKKPKDIYAFSALFYLSSLAIVSNIFFLIGATMAERFLFFPSVAFCIVVAQLIVQWTGVEQSRLSLFKNKKLLLALAPLILVYAGLTIARNGDWKDSYTLYKADIEHAGDNYRIPYYLGSALINASNEEADTAARRAMLTEAIGYLKRSIAVYPDFKTPWSQTGISYTNLGQYDSAERYDLGALALDPRDTFTRNNLAAVYFKKGAYQHAIGLSRMNIAIDSGYVQGYTNIGACYLKMGRYDSAVMVLKKAWQLRPGEPRTGYFLSVAYAQLGNADSAKMYQAQPGG